MHRQGLNITSAHYMKGSNINNNSNNRAHLMMKMLLCVAWTSYIKKVVKKWTTHTKSKVESSQDEKEASRLQLP